MNITLCIDIFENGSSNERLSKQVSEEYKHLNSGDMIDIEDYEFMISRKKIKLNSMFLYCDYHVDENQDSVKSVVDRLQSQDFYK